MDDSAGGQRLRQVNTWTGSGHEFFAEHRLVRDILVPCYPPG
jgi:hypothetical protein